MCDYRSIQCEVALKLESLQKCERNCELYRYVGSTIAYPTNKTKPLSLADFPNPNPTQHHFLYINNHLLHFNSFPLNHSPSTEHTYLVSTAGPINHLLLLQEHLVLVDGCEEGPVLLPCLVQVLHLRLEVVDPFTNLQEPCKQSSYVDKYAVPQEGDISGKDMKPDHTNNV